MLHIKHLIDVSNRCIDKRFQRMGVFIASLLARSCFCLECPFFPLRLWLGGICRGTQVLEARSSKVCFLSLIFTQDTDSQALLKYEEKKIWGPLLILRGLQALENLARSEFPCCPVPCCPPPLSHLPLWPYTSSLEHLLFLHMALLRAPLSSTLTQAGSWHYARSDGRVSLTSEPFWLL
jgi:hypothetical protein